jgi:hypothetical protein
MDSLNHNLLELDAYNEPTSSDFPTLSNVTSGMDARSFYPSARGNSQIALIRPISHDNIYSRPFEEDHDLAEPGSPNGNAILSLHPGIKV